MNIEIFNCEQGTPEWHACRLGIPTASEFHAVTANGKGGAESKTRREYMLKLIGERMTGKSMQRFSNEHTERGKEMEDEARQLYAMVSDNDPKQVGFIRNNHLGCGASPDSLVAEVGLLEIKTKLPHLQLELLLRKEKFPPDRHLPPEHCDQVQGQLWVSGRQWLDFVSYWPGLPMFMVRVSRDEEYIQKILAPRVAEFNAELLALMSKVAA